MIRTALAALAFSASGLLVHSATAQTAPAQDGRETASRTFSYSDLDLRRAADARKLYNRIVAVADSLCGGEPLPGVERGALDEYSQCKKDAITQAAAKVDSPYLTALVKGGFPTLASN